MAGAGRWLCKEGQIDGPCSGEKPRQEEARRAEGLFVKPGGTELKLVPRNGCSLPRHRAGSLNLSLLSLTDSISIYHSLGFSLT